MGKLLDYLKKSAVDAVGKFAKGYSSAIEATRNIASVAGGGLTKTFTSPSLYPSKSVTPEAGGQETEFDPGKAGMPSRYPSYSGAFGAGMTGTETGGSGMGGTETGGLETGGSKTGGKAEEKTQPYSYAQYLTDEEARIKEYRAILEDQAKKEREDALALAEENHQEASADAQAAYRRNLVTYGSQAEQLSRMGLSGSGYSDYLTGKAYSAMRGDIAAANSEKNAAEQLANREYSEKLFSANQYENEKMGELNKEKINYSTELMDKRSAALSSIGELAASGMPLDYLKTYYKNLTGAELTGSELTAVQKIIDEYSSSEKAAFLDNVLANAGSYTLDEIIALADEKGLKIRDENNKLLPEYQEEGVIDNAIENANTKEEEAALAAVIALIMQTEGGINALEFGTLKSYMDSLGIPTGKGSNGDKLLMGHKDYVAPKEDDSETVTVGGETENVPENTVNAVKLSIPRGDDTANGSAGDNFIFEDTKGNQYRVERGDRVEDTVLNNQLTTEYSKTVGNWKQTNYSQNVGAVVEHDGKIYCFLPYKEDGKTNYSWCEVAERAVDAWINKNASGLIDAGNTFIKLFNKKENEEKRLIKSGYKKLSDMLKK